VFAGFGGTLREGPETGEKLAVMTELRSRNRSFLEEGIYVTDLVTSSSSVVSTDEEIVEWQRNQLRLMRNFVVDYSRRLNLGVAWTDDTRAPSGMTVIEHRIIIPAIEDEIIDQQRYGVLESKEKSRKIIPKHSGKPALVESWNLECTSDRERGMILHRKDPSFIGGPMNLPHPLLQTAEHHRFVETTTQPARRRRNIGPLELLRRVDAANSAVPPAPPAATISSSYQQWYNSSGGQGGFGPTVANPQPLTHEWVPSNNNRGRSQSRSRRPRNTGNPYNK
jgi:hypothetical protein